MRKVGRVLLWGLGLPFALILVLAVLVDIFDRQLIANPVAALVEERTGRDLTVRAFDLRWLRPGVYMGGLTFANAPWAGDDPMFQVEEAWLTLQPSRLFQGAPFGELVLQSPRLRLETSAEGEGNWVFPPTDPTEDSDEAARLPLRVLLSDGEVLYLDEAVELSYALDLERLEASPVGEGEASQSVALLLLANRDGVRLDLRSNVTLGAQAWQGDFELGLDESDLHGEFAIDLSGSPRQVQATLVSELLVPEQIAAMLPEPQPDPDSTRNEYLPLPAWNDLEVQVDLRVAGIRLPGMTLRNIGARLLMEENFAALTSLAASLGDATLQGEVELDTAVAEPALVARLLLEEAGFANLPTQWGLTEVPGLLSGELRASLGLPQGQLPLLPETLLDQFAVQLAELRYEREDAALSIEAAVEPAGGEPRLVARLSSPNAAAVEASLQAPPVRELGDGPYPLALQLTTEGAQALISASLDKRLPEEGLSLRVEARGDQLPAFPAFDLVPPAVLPFSIQGELRQEAEGWWLRNTDITYGSSRLRADASWLSGGERPRLVVEASADLVDLPAIRQDLQGNAAEPDLPAAVEEGVEAVVEDTVEAVGEEAPDLLAALKALDVDLVLSAERVLVQPGLELDGARLEALLEGGELHVDPLSLGLAGGQLAGGIQVLGSGERLEANVDLEFTDLQPAAFAAALSRLGEALGPLSGGLRLSAVQVSAEEGAGALRLPYVGALALGGELSLASPEQTDLLISLALPAANPQAAAPQKDGLPLRLQGKGQLRGAPLELSLQGGDPQLLTADGSAYPLVLGLSLAGATLNVEGETQPFAQLPTLAIQLRAQAQDPTALQGLLAPWWDGVLLPFSLAAQVSRNGDELVVSELEAQAGLSDLAGDLRFLPAQAPPRLEADLQSRQVDLAQLKDLLLGEAAPEGPEDARPDAEAVPAPQPAQILPDEPFDLALLEALQVDLAYAAEAITAGEAALGSFTAVVSGQEGELKVEPLHWQSGQGEVSIRSDLRVEDDMLAGVAEIDLRKLDLGSLLRTMPMAGNQPGLLGGEGKVWMRGNSIASLLGSLDGGLLLIMTGGQLNPLLVEASGLDVAEAAATALTDAAAVPIDCAYISLYANRGEIDIDNFVIDSEDTTFYLDGSLSLATEEIDLTFYPEAKDPSVLAADAPIEIGGTLASPEIGIVTGNLALQGAQALAIGALAGPAAALLPFLEAGEGQEAPACEGWASDTQEDLG